MSPHFEPGWVCPRCKAPADGIGLIRGEATPEVGDVVVCCYCAAVNLIQPGRVLREAKPFELESLEREDKEDIMRTVAAVVASPLFMRHPS